MKNDISTKGTTADDSAYYSEKINQFKQQSQKPLVTRVNTEVLVKALSMNITPFTNISYLTPKAILLYLGIDYHCPIIVSHDRKFQSQLVLFALKRLMDIYYPPVHAYSSPDEIANYKYKILINDKYEIINPKLILEIGYRKTLGDTGKYFPGSWVNLDSETFLNGALRHLLKYDDGKVEDEDGGTHLSAAAWNMTCLYWTLSKSKNDIKLAQSVFKKYKEEYEIKIVSNSVNNFICDEPKKPVNTLEEAKELMTDELGNDEKCSEEKFKGKDCSNCSNICLKEGLDRDKNCSDIQNIKVGRMTTKNTININEIDVKNGITIQTEKNTEDDSILNNGEKNPRFYAGPKIKGK